MAEKIKAFYAKHTISKLLLTVAAVAALVYVAVSIPVWAVKRADVPEVSSRAPLEGTKIANDSGKLRLAESEGVVLELDTDTLTFEVTNAEGKKFSSAVKGV